MSCGKIEEKKPSDAPKDDDGFVTFEEKRKWSYIDAEMLGCVLALAALAALVWYSCR